MEFESILSALTVDYGRTHTESRPTPPTYLARAELFEKRGLKLLKQGAMAKRNTLVNRWQYSSGGRRGILSQTCWKLDCLHNCVERGHEWDAGDTAMFMSYLSDEPGIVA
jgi:hypothetical protein